MGFYVYANGPGGCLGNPSLVFPDAFLFIPIELFALRCPATPGKPLTPPAISAPLVYDILFSNSSYLFNSKSSRLLLLCSSALSPTFSFNISFPLS